MMPALIGILADTIPGPPLVPYLYPYLVPRGLTEWADDEQWSTQDVNMGSSPTPLFSTYVSDYVWVGDDIGRIFRSVGTNEPDIYVLQQMGQFPVTKTVVNFARDPLTTTVIATIGNAGGNDTVYQSPDDGITWLLRECSGTANTFNDAIWDPVRSQFFGVGEPAISTPHFVYSADGVSWSTYAFGFGGAFYCLHQNPITDDIWIGGASGELYRSANPAGAAWTNVPNPWVGVRNINEIVIGPTGTIVCTSTGMGMFSNDNGATWTEVALDNASDTPYDMIWSPSLNQAIVATRIGATGKVQGLSLSGSPVWVLYTNVAAELFSVGELPLDQAAPAPYEPPFADVFTWNEADNLELPQGAGVTSWPPKRGTATHWNQDAGFSGFPDMDNLSPPGKGLKFSNTDQDRLRYFLGGLFFPGPMTVYIVCDVAEQAFGMLFTTNKAGVPDWYQVSIDVGRTIHAQRYRVGGAPPPGYDTLTVAGLSAGPHLITTLFNAASSELAIDGGVPVVGPLGGNQSQTTDQANIGGYPQNPSFSGHGFNNNIYAILIYTVAHDAPTRAAIEGWLKTKYGLP